MKKMNANEIKAYEIGIAEARERKCIVPAYKSNKMNQFMNEIKNGLLPLIKAYNAGVAAEISRQTRIEL